MHATCWRHAAVAQTHAARPWPSPTNIYTEEDAQVLALTNEAAARSDPRVEPGRQPAPHRIREDASINLEAVRGSTDTRSLRLEVIFIESGGDNLDPPTFSPRALRPNALRDRRGRGRQDPGARAAARTIPSRICLVYQQDRPGADGGRLARGEGIATTQRGMRGARPFVFTNLKTGHGPRCW